jgi:hypothetical protein
MLSPTPVFLDSSFPLPIDRPFTTAQALDAGLAARRLTRLVREGYLRRPIERVYVPAHLPDSIELRCRALGLVVPPGAFVCDRPAAWLHAGARALAPNEHLSVPHVSCFRPSGHGRLRNALTVSGERAVLPRDLMELHGIVVTTPLRTALDLGRLQPTRDLRLWGMDLMLGLGRFSLEELLAELPRFKGQRGIVEQRVLAPLADGGAASLGEAALRNRWHDAGLPRPRTQIPVEVDGRVVYLLDMGLEELLFAAEYDGRAWHSSAAQREHDRGRRQWLTDQRRWHLEVFVDHNVFGRHQDADVRLARAFAEARASFGTRTFVV